jgi:hypothetical protein
MEDKSEGHRERMRFGIFIAFSAQAVEFSSSSSITALASEIPIS